MGLLPPFFNNSTTQSDFVKIQNVSDQVGSSSVVHSDRSRCWFKYNGYKLKLHQILALDYHASNTFGSTITLSLHPTFVSVSLRVSLSNLDSFSHFSLCVTFQCGDNRTCKDLACWSWSQGVSSYVFAPWCVLPSVSRLKVVFACARSNGSRWFSSILVPGNVTL